MEQNSMKPGDTARIAGDPMDVGLPTRFRDIEFTIWSDVGDSWLARKSNDDRNPPTLYIFRKGTLKSDTGENTSNN